MRSAWELEVARLRRLLRDREIELRSLHRSSPRRPIAEVELMAIRDRLRLIGLSLAHRSGS